MKLSLDDVLESEGPFHIITTDKLNDLKGKLGDAIRRAEAAEASNRFLQTHIRNLEKLLDD